MTLSSDGKHAYVAGFNDDAVSWYDRNASTGALSYGGMLQDGVNGVDGLDYAYNITLSSDGNHAYATGSSDDAVSWYERNASTGALTYGGMLKDGVDGVDGLNGASSVTISSDGKHAYVTGTVDDAVSWYDRNASTGALTYGGMLKDGVDGVDGLNGATSVTLSSDGKHGYVTGNIDDAVSWFTHDPLTGALSYGSAIDANYTLTAADAGSVISVVASYTDGGGSLEQVHSAGIIIGSPPMQLITGTGTGQIGLTKLKDIAFEGNSSYPVGFTEYKGEVYFSAVDQHGMELWKTDSTQAGTAMLKDIMPGTDGEDPITLPFLMISFFLCKRWKWF